MENNSSMIPPPLLKATEDPFSYLIILKSGHTIDFESAEIEGEFATLRGAKFRNVEFAQVNTERGVAVRISEIVLAIDAPFGS